MDYATDVTDKNGEKKYPKWIIRDAKWVWPIVVMYLPVTFFWALFDMQGSRWTLTGNFRKKFLTGSEIGNKSSLTNPLF